MKHTALRNPITTRLPSTARRHQTASTNTRIVMFQTHNIKLLTSGSSSMEIPQRDMPELPHDVLVQIASRSSPATLASFRATSKILNRATYEAAFASLHSVSGHIVQSVVKHEYKVKFVGRGGKNVVVLDFLPLKVKVNPCSDAGLGLIYCESQEPQSRRNHGVKSYYVCKGTTREWRQVPNPRTRGEEWGSASASGIVEVKSDPIRYKIVRLSPAPLSTQTRFDYYRFNFHVFDSGTPGRWRRLEGEVRLEREAGEWVGSISKMVTVNGNLHLLVGPNRVLAFDSVSEEWGFFATPEQENDGLTLKLLKYQGKLGLIMKSRTETTLWIMEDYGNKRWTRSEVDAGAALEMMGDQLGYDLLPGSVFGFRSDFRKMGWRTAAEAKGYAERQEAKERARENINAAVEK